MQKLLTEYNLTMEEVGEEKEENPVIGENISGFSYKSIGGVWELRLTHVLCQWNFCKVYTYGNTYKKLIIVGRKDNVEMVKWLAEVLKERFVSFSKTHYKEFVKDCEARGVKPYSKDKYQRSYLCGCAQGLDEKLKEEHEREKKEEVELSTKITALVVRNNAAIDEYVQQKWGAVKRGRTM